MSFTGQYMEADINLGGSGKLPATIVRTLVSMTWLIGPKSRGFLCLFVSKKIQDNAVTSLSLQYSNRSLAQ